MTASAPRQLPCTLLTICAVVTASSVPAQDNLQALEEQTLKAAVAAVSPSVLRIETVGGLEQIGQVLTNVGPTTGLVVSEEGYIVSSAFNFVQLPSAILVNLPDGTRATADIVARDRSRMLVMLKVNTDQALTVPEFAPRDEMVVGQWTVAVGRTYDADQPNVSIGILSAKNRIWGRAIQTDARISPANYGGPLIDIRGRVLGVLVPLSPQRHDDIAGTEWYDSGIGFAVPLADWLPRLETLRAGDDLYPGILGVALKGNDVYSVPAEITACLPKSPAAAAGLQPGDEIVECDGAAVRRQADLKHALGPRYAGDRVQIVVKRGDQRVELAVELADKLEPYENPFLGILPDRSPGTAPGVRVRYVYPGSPADQAGMRAEDRLLHVSARQVANASEVWEVLAAFEPGEEVPLSWEREGQVTKRSITLASLPEAIPQDLPLAREPMAESKDERPTSGVLELRVPEETNACLAYVPDNYHPRVAYGVVIVLDEPGEFNRDATLARWKEHCLANELILLAPQPSDPKRWQATEIEFIRKVLEQVASQYNVDSTRIVGCGHQAGGVMVLLAAFTHRDLIRGVAVTDAPLPSRLRIPPNEPMRRLALFFTSAAKAKQAKQIEGSVQELKKLRYPTVLRTHENDPRVWDTDELREVVRWIDTLDRL